MAVFPRGGDSERIPARVPGVGGRNRGTRQRWSPVQMFRAALDFIYSSVKEKQGIRQNQTCMQSLYTERIEALTYWRRGEDQNRWQESPWANDAYPTEHWELLTIWTKSNEQPPLRGFPSEKT
ncbi:unnamed protein product [Pleuronectes platessa]|uniref:Uncharacterized protein n=1 Tax=Pleuronectes platessa TaxID=8262 RepID=A0A9N7YMK1_PLEPL|nr:unnamed protein product [Pleuronectes platessa]